MTLPATCFPQADWPKLPSQLLVERTDQVVRREEEVEERRNRLRRVEARSLDNADRIVLERSEHPVDVIVERRRGEGASLIRRERALPGDDVGDCASVDDNVCVNPAVPVPERARVELAGKLELRLRQYDDLDFRPVRRAEAGAAFLMSLIAHDQANIPVGVVSDAESCRARAGEHEAENCLVGARELDEFLVRHRSSRRWQRGQNHVPRPPTRVLVIVARHRRHGSPSRPYTRNSFCIEPDAPSGVA